MFVRYGLGFGVGIVRGKGVRIPLPDGVVIEIGSGVAHISPFIEKVVSTKGRAFVITSDFLAILRIVGGKWLEVREVLGAAEGLRARAVPTSQKGAGRLVVSARPNRVFGKTHCRHKYELQNSEIVVFNEHEAVSDPVSDGKSGLFDKEESKEQEK